MPDVAVDGAHPLQVESARHIPATASA